MRHLLPALAAVAALLPIVSADAQTYYLRAKGVPTAPPAACSVSLVGVVPASVRGTPFGMSFRTTQPAPAPLGHSLVGTPPPGLVFNAATQTLTGTPTAAGRFGPLRVAVTSRGSASGDFCKSDEFYVDVAPADCSAPWGAAVAHGTSVTAFFSSSVPFGSTCEAAAQTRSCDDGALGGSAPNRDCAVAAATNCTAPWGLAVAHGATVQGFTSSVAPYGSSCSNYQQARTCSNGTLSGTATNASCSVAAPTDCSAPWGQSVPHGSTVQGFTSSVAPFGTSCASYQQARTCSNGTLSGNAVNGTCSEAQPTYSWSAGSFGSCSATCGGGTQSRSVSCVRQDGVAVADFYCSGPKPAASQSCNTQACASKTCGTMQFRKTTSDGVQYDQSYIYDMNQCRQHCQAYPGIAACIWNSTGLCTRMSAASGLTGQYSGSWSTQTLYASMCY